MDSSAFDRLTRLFGSSTGRRAALATTAASGLAALTASSADAQQDDDDPEAARRRRRGRGRGRGRNRRGRRGRPGPPGPPAGAGIKVVTEPCNSGAQADGATHDCTAECGPGFVATGGGYEMDNLFSDLAIVRQSMPDLDTDDSPTGWFVRVEFVDAGTLTYNVYAVCVPL